MTGLGQQRVHVRQCGVHLAQGRGQQPGQFLARRHVRGRGPQPVFQHGGALFGGGQVNGRRP